jgi:Na+/H+ antiporter NhaA
MRSKATKSLFSPFEQFTCSESAGGLAVLISAALVAFIWAVSLFVSGLAFEGSEEILDQAKPGVPMVSVVATALGPVLLGRCASSDAG